MKSEGRERLVVLVGGGHSHVEVLRRAIMRPMPRARLLLLTEGAYSAYSGRVPSLIAGECDRDALRMDIRPLARRAGATVVLGRMTSMDAVARRIHIEGRPSITYDLCSLDVGGSVAGLSTPGVREFALPTRPLRALLDRVDALDDGVACIAVVGAGMAGVELAFALRQRIRTASVTLVERAARILPGQSASLRRAVNRALSDRGITVRTRAHVQAVFANGLVLDDGQRIPSDVTVWAPGAAPHPALAESGLPTGPRGFIQVGDDLRVLGYDNLFAAGDCAVPASRPDLPRAGVHAVRMGPILANNLHATLDGRPLEDYRAQRSMLALLNVCDGTAIASKLGVSVRGAWAARWKTRIDQLWLDRYQGDGLPVMQPMPMLCSGCAAKVPPDVLGPALHGMVEGVVGEDAARVSDTLSWTVDAFPAFNDDPYFVAQVAAGHALADLWCKGAKPTHALALVTIEEGSESAMKAQLEQVQRGLLRVLQAHGIALVGGHTVSGAELTVGLTALGCQQTFLGLERAQSGDVLLLTQALGTGIALRADAFGQMLSAPMAAVEEAMLRVDSGLVDVADRLHAATDVSGFGLANHLLDMLRASDLVAHVDTSALPVLPGVPGALASGVRSTSAPANAHAARPDVSLSNHPNRPLWFDPQTGGGVLVACPAEQVPHVQQALGATVIGRLAKPDGGPRIRDLSGPAR